MEPYFVDCTHRYQPAAGGFGSSYPGHLLPTDRSKYTDEAGKKKFKVEAHLHIYLGSCTQ